MTTDYDILLQKLDNPSDTMCYPGSFCFVVKMEEGTMLSFLLADGSKLGVAVPFGTVFDINDMEEESDSKVIKIIHKSTLRQFTPQSFLEFIESPI
jgi:hypothetical protein